MADQRTTRISTPAPAIYALGALVLLAVIFTLSSPSARFESDDALHYASAVEFGEPEDLTIAYHLAYVPLMKVLFEVTQVFDPDVSALSVMVPAGAIIAAAACGLFVLVLREWLRVGSPLAIFGGVALACSYGFWRYAGEAEVYALASLLSLVLLLAAVRVKPTAGGAVIIAVLACAAILGHVLNIALVVAVPYLLYKRGWSWRLIATTGVIGIALLAPLLWGVYQFDASNTGEATNLTGFISQYTTSDTKGGLQPRDLIAAAAVVLSLVVGTNGIFLYEPLRTRIVEALPGQAIQDELYMGTTAPDWLRWAFPIALVAVAAALFFLLRHLKFGHIIKSTEGRFLLIWIPVYIGIAILGEAIVQPEVWVLFLIPLWLTLVLSLRGASLGPRSLALVGAAIALSSLVGGLLPVHLGGNRQAELSGWLADNTTSEDLVLTADSSGLARYIAYHRPPQVAFLADAEYIEVAKSLIVGGESTHDIAAALEEEKPLQGHRSADEAKGDLYVTREVFDPPEWLVQSNPEVAAQLTDLGESVSHLFQPVEGSELYLVRRNP